MSYNINKLFTIGQFAALHHVNKKTLMWYDEVGLLKPATVQENGYRYYSYQQCSVFETILMLRELKVSIPEIKQFMEHRSAESFQAVLSDKTLEIDEAIQHLLQIKKALLHQTKELKNIGNIDIDEYCMVDLPEQKLVVLKTAREFTLEQETEMILTEVHHHKAYRMYGILYGALLPVSSIYQHDFTAYCGVSLKIPEAEIYSNTHIQPAGLYLRTYCKGNWDKLPEKYSEILKYAADHHIELCGYAYETGMNEAISDSAEDYITKIEIPIKIKS